jgi:hypothetical protein
MQTKPFPACTCNPSLGRPKLKNEITFFSLIQENELDLFAKIGELDET